MSSTSGRIRTRHRDNKWMAAIGYDGETIYVGLFDDEIETEERNGNHQYPLNSALLSGAYCNYSEGRRVQEQHARKHIGLLNRSGPNISVTTWEIAKMRRRDFLKNSAMAASGFLTAAGSVRFARAASQQRKSRPNILWITCEDLSARLGCYGDRTVATPNIDRLAREGVRYTHAFATTGVCAPSRHALITGMYPTSTYALQMRNLARTSALKEIKDPVTRAFATTRPLYEAVPPAEVRCLTEYLRLAGYYCCNNVKQDYQFRAPVTAWDESSRQAHWRRRSRANRSSPSSTTL